MSITPAMRSLWLDICCSFALSTAGADVTALAKPQSHAWHNESSRILRTVWMFAQVFSQYRYRDTCSGKEVCDMPDLIAQSCKIHPIQACCNSFAGTHTMSLLSC